jgi:methylthioribose-1-phosphate isomerase
MRRVGAHQTAPDASPVYNPAFDVTPAALIAAIVTERGVFRAPYRFGGAGPLVDRAR